MSITYKDHLYQFPRGSMVRITSIDRNSRWLPFSDFFVGKIARKYDYQDRIELDSVPPDIPPHLKEWTSRPGNGSVVVSINAYAELAEDPDGNY